MSEPEANENGCSPSSKVSEISSCNDIVSSAAGGIRVKGLAELTTPLSVSETEINNTEEAAAAVSTSIVGKRPLDALEESQNHELAVAQATGDEEAEAACSTSKRYRADDSNEVAAVSTETAAEQEPIKQEPVDNEVENSSEAIASAPIVTNDCNINQSTADIKPAVKVEKVDATSSTTSAVRQSCRFGIRCYRRNPMHRQEEAHPGDQDYKRPNYPSPPKGTPDCPFGNRCYRRNPVHFQNFSHPPDN